MRRRAPGKAALLGLLLVGCMVGPDYKRPEVKVTETFRDQVKPADARSFADQPWWEIFQDEALQALIAEALENNYDLHAAVARVEQARAQAGIARAQVWPAFGVGAGAGYGRGGFIPGLVAPPAGSSSGAVPQRNAQYNLFVGMQWDLDLWGKLRRSSEAAVAQFLASEDTQRGVIISLIADVAQAYVTLRLLDAQLEISRETVKNYQKTLELYTARLEGGTGNKLEVSVGQAQVADAQATASDLERQITDQENQICFLLGRPPGPVPRGKTLTEFSLPPEIPAGLPSSLLERRPDVRRAEQDLIAANARIGVAQANFYPQITLTGSLGFASTDLGNLFTGKSFLWNIGGFASWLAPILQGAQLKSQYDAAWASWLEFLAVYQRSVINALREVASSLNDVAQLKPVLEQRTAQVKSLEESVSLSIDRYEGGVASYLEVTTNQNVLFPAQLNLASVRAQRFVALITLYRALGGGWQVPPPPDQQAAAEPDGGLPAAAPAK